MNIAIVKKSVKHINIRVKPSGEVVLTAPLGTEESYIQSVIAKKRAWIEKKLKFYSEHNFGKEREKEFVSGESFRYLGKNYRLKVMESDKNEIVLQRGYIQLYVRDRNDFSLKKKLVEMWYKKQAGEYFEKIVQEYAAIVKKTPSSVQIRKMKTKWGSCNPEKLTITLNQKLIEKPLHCIEYVIFHELAHFLYPNHSKEFYSYLSTYMSDWEKRKRELEEV